jgi:hypothetical protein
MLNVKNWSEIFENNRSREIKDLQWVLIPNRHDGAKFSELMDHKNGPAHFAAWILILQVASRVRESRGYLRRGDGTPYTSKSLALMTRCPESIFDEAIPRLLKLGWLEIIENKPIPQEGAGIPQEGAGIPQEGAGSRARARIELKGTEQNRTEQITTPLTPLAGGNIQTPKEKFEIFRKEYPGTKGGPNVEWKNFKRKAGKNFHVIASLLLPALDAEKLHREALVSRGVFCPEWANFRTWINQHRWEQEFSKEALNGHARNHRPGSRAARLDEDGRALARKIAEAAGSR